MTEKKKERSGQKVDDEDEFSSGENNAASATRLTARENYDNLRAAAFIVPAIIGNITGGGLFVALLNHGQVSADQTAGDVVKSK